MSLHQSLRRLFGRSLSHSSNRAKPSRRRPIRFEQLEGRALLTGVSGDFNGDGFDDLAIGSPFDHIGDKADSGSVQVLYGSPFALSAEGNRRFTLNSSGMAGGGAVGGEHFGAALVAGDFNGDGYDDLAIGSPDEIVNGIGAGAVHILYGSRHGLRTNGNQLFHQDVAGINGHGAAGDKFGSALAAGDFNHDGRDDLAVGVRGKEVGGSNGAGAVNIIYGRKSGLTAKGDRQFTQDSAGIWGASDVDSNFGAALAVGDFDGDARDDLAIGVINMDVESTIDAGAVIILYGSRQSGLVGSGSQHRHLAQDNVLGKITADGQFGFALAAGDFNDDSRDDLAVGSPGENISVNDTPQVSGSVHIFYGGRNGTTITGNQKWDKFASGTQEVPADGDRYGSVLAVGQINRDRRDDLIIGSPGSSVGSTTGAGTIRALFGAATGLTSNGTANINQTSTNITGSTPEMNDAFGSALTMGDYNGDGLMDVAVGAEADQNTDNLAVGSVTILFGVPSTLSATGGQIWRQGEGGLPGTPQVGDKFGGVLG